MPLNAHACVSAVVHWFETLTPATLGAIDGLYAADARFKDPFNDVQGRERIRAVLAHMFEQVAEPRFVVDSVALQGHTAYLGWAMHYRRHGGTQVHSIVGCTRLQLGESGLVAEHRDFWDPAEAVYAQVPLLGRLLAWLRRRLAAPQR